MERATRHNEGKLKWSLVSSEALEPLVKVLEFGAKKYEIDNWKKGLYTTEICESMLRHIFAYLNGENRDEDSGLSHIGHIQANAMFLGFMDLKMPQFDDRESSKMLKDYRKEFITAFGHLSKDEEDKIIKVFETMEAKEPTQKEFEDLKKKVTSAEDVTFSQVADAIKRHTGFCEIPDLHDKLIGNTKDVYWFTGKEILASRKQANYELENLLKCIVNRDNRIKELTKNLNLYTVEDTEKTYVESMGGAYNPPKDKRPFAPLFNNKKAPKPII